MRQHIECKTYIVSFLSNVVDLDVACLGQTFAIDAKRKWKAERAWKQSATGPRKVHVGAFVNKCLGVVYTIETGQEEDSKGSRQVGIGLSTKGTYR